MGCKVNFRDNSGEVLAAFREQLTRGLEMAGMAAESNAKGLCPVDTGNLRNSLTHTVQGESAIIGTNSHYAAYVEFGTGVHCTLGGGRNTPWRYQGNHGWVTTTGSPAQPYLKPAVADNMAQYQQIIENALKS